MKNKFILPLLGVFTLIFSGCNFNETEDLVAEPTAKFYSVSGSVIVDSNDVEYQLAVQLPEAYTADKVVNVVVSDASTAQPLDYSFTGSLVVKAGELIAYSPISFNFEGIPSNVPRTLVLNIEGTNEEITLEYTKVCRSNDVNLSLTFDRFPGETSWTIEDSSGNVVQSGNGYSTPSTTLSIDITLPDGTYKFTISDSFGDGICCSWGNGSYTLSKPACSEIFVTGGEFGRSEETTFSVP